VATNVRDAGCVLELCCTVQEREFFVKTNSCGLMGVLSVLAMASVVSSAFAGMVDVAASGPIPKQPTLNQWTAGLTPPVSARAGSPNSENTWAPQRTSSTPNDQESNPDSGDSGHVLVLARGVSFSLPHAAVNLSSAEGDSSRARKFASNPARTGHDDARALALPDALRMFPLGAAVAAVAIRRMQRVK